MSMLSAIVRRLLSPPAPARRWGPKQGPKRGAKRALGRLSTIGTSFGPWLGLLAAPFLVALCVLAFHAVKKPFTTPRADENYYLAIAHGLNLYGVFSDGIVHPSLTGRPALGQPPAGNGAPEQAFGARLREPGRFFAPAYPLLIHLLSRLDRGLGATVACHAERAAGLAPAAGLPPDKGPAACPNRFGTLIAAHVGLGALSMALVFAIAWQLGASRFVAWATMLIALEGGEFGFYARSYLTENVAFPAFFAFLALLVLAVRRALSGAGEVGTLDSPRAALAAAGFALGLAALSRPVYVGLVGAIAAVLALAPLMSRYLAARRVGSAAPAAVGPASLAAITGLLPAALLLAGGLLPLLPWMARNWALFGDPALAGPGYAALALSQRVAFNQMSWAQWAVSFVYWLPDFGTRLARALFAPELYGGLAWRGSQAYISIGTGPLRQETLAAAGSVQAQVGYLVRHYILADPIKHVAVTATLALRGLWVGKYLALAGVALIWPVGRWLARRGRLWPYLAFIAPPLVMVAVHGFLTVNVLRYNVPVVAIFAFTTAVALERGLRLALVWWRGRRAALP